MRINPYINIVNISVLLLHDIKSESKKQPVVLHNSLRKNVKFPMIY